ncbi:DUF2938 domain-containing protein [Geminicoccus flavidas]|uniref:DUF2938 domain-containing protein n=1 Tax=Geminicoccus flavidas TaxID=2506407 RepID=UPI001359FFDB|nr:DUF2938 domain-containing protein [Geminicoccus flavidas]
MNTSEIIIRAAAVGIGGTIVLDLYAFLLQRFFGVPATDWAMVGRWVGHMPRGRFIHQNIGKAAPVAGEHAVGWAVHYVIGIVYGLLLVGLWGAEWLRQPTFLPPMILALGLLVAPYFIMMPGMGLGVAGAKTPKPNMTRLKSVAGHSMFGLGMYGTALVVEACLGWRHHGYGMMGNGDWAWMMMFGPLMMILFIATVVALVAFVLRWLTGGGTHGSVQ